MVLMGKVFLVGAGPGDAGLITLRGCQCLAEADAVFYDYLVNPQILAHARADAELVCIGRHGQGRILSTDEVNGCIVELARAGQTVVRLKGGDPAVFAHAAEEIAALEAARINYEIVPGITAALAVGSYAGIPLTHGDVASAVALVTGQERCGKPAENLDYAQLAAFPGTLVFYMGVTTARDWTAALVAAGKPPQTPAAIVRRCSWPDQQTIRCTLAGVADEVEARRLRPPALVVVGAVAALVDEHNWFTQRPLFGARVLVTRAAGQRAGLAATLAESGAEVLFQPAIEIGPPDEFAPLDRAIGRLDQYDWLVFASANGVQAFFKRLLGGRDLRALGRARLAAIGSATADELARYHLHADLMPDEYRSESLVESLGGEAAAGRRFLLVRANRGRELLAEELSAAGGRVEQVVAYTSRDVAAADPRVAELLGAEQIDWVTVTSSAIARSLVRLFGDALGKTKLASISPLTSATLSELGYGVAAEARTATMEGLVAAILAAHIGSDRG